MLRRPFLLGKYTIGGEKTEMSTAYGGARNKVQLDVFGLLSDDPDGPNNFRHFNRVRLYKCTYDRFSGNHTAAGEPIPRLAGDDADLPNGPLKGSGTARGGKGKR